MTLKLTSQGKWLIQAIAKKEVEDGDIPLTTLSTMLEEIDIATINGEVDWSEVHSTKKLIQIAKYLGLLSEE
jgi:hypothetical protein